MKEKILMPIVKWRPRWASLLDEDFDRFFEDFPAMPREMAKNFVLAVDIYEKDDKVVVEAPLAGVDPNDVEISIEKNVLTIAGKSERKREVDEKNFYRKEVRYGSFFRSVPLPASVKGEEATAVSEDGMLKIEVPKAEEEKKKTIKIEVKK